MAESYHNKINLNWEQTRYLATMIHNANCKKKSQMLKPDQLFKLPSDYARKKKQSIPKSTPKQMSEFLNKYNSMTKKTTLN